MILYTTVLSRREDAKRPSKFFGPFQGHLACKDTAAEIFGQNYLFHKENINRGVSNIYKKFTVIQGQKIPCTNCQLLGGTTKLTPPLDCQYMVGRRIIFDTFTGRKLNYNSQCTIVCSDLHLLGKMKNAYRVSYGCQF
jgi:hypothetical protein